MVEELTSRQIWKTQEGMSQADQASAGKSAMAVNRYLLDLDVVFGNWPLAIQDMAAALQFREYDFKFVMGNGGHNLHHGGAIFPNTLRWLWRDTPSAASA